MQSDDLCVLADVKQWLGLGIEAETLTVPATTTYTVTVAKAASFTDDLGVVDIATGAPMTEVAASPGPANTGGQYSVSNGVYTFNAHDASKKVGIAYMTFGSDDTLLARLITAVSNFIRSTTTRNFNVQTYTEIRDGQSQNSLFLRQFPIQLITSLTVNGQPVSAIAGNVYTPGARGYLYTLTDITLYGYEFTRGRNNISIVYSAGYSTIPYDLAQAAIELVCFKYREKDRIGHSSKSIAGETVSFIIKDVPESVRSVLNKYNSVLPI